MKTEFNDENWKLFYNTYLKDNTNFNYLMEQEFDPNPLAGRRQQRRPLKSVLTTFNNTAPISELAAINISNFEKLWKKYDPQDLATFFIQRLFTIVALQVFLDNFKYKPSTSDFEYGHVLGTPVYSMYFNENPPFALARLAYSSGKNNNITISISDKIDLYIYNEPGIASSFNDIKVQCKLYVGLELLNSKTIPLSQLWQTAQELMERSGL